MRTFFLICAASLPFGGVVIAQTAPTQASDAQKTAQQVWAKILTKCGDSYYFRATEYKTPSFELQPLTLSPADKLNGVQWMGYAVLRALVYRSAGGIWFDGTKRKGVGYDANSAYGGLIVLSMAKVNGKWSVFLAESPEVGLSPMAGGNFEMRNALTPDDVEKIKATCP